MVHHQIDFEIGETHQYHLLQMIFVYFDCALIHAEELFPNLFVFVLFHFLTFLVEVVSVSIIIIFKTFELF